MPNVRIAMEFNDTIAGLDAAVHLSFVKGDPDQRATAMSDDPTKNPAPAPDAARKPLPPQAQRALAEAEERRLKAAQEKAPAGPKEIQGPKGPEPTRYGDWEVRGIASDF